jgi:hypothetical protein
MPSDLAASSAVGRAALLLANNYDMRYDETLLCAQRAVSNHEESLEDAETIGWAAGRLGQGCWIDWVEET